MPRKGYKQTLEHRQKISENCKGIKKLPFSEEHKRKLSNSKKGHFVSNKTREKMRLSQLGTKKPWVKENRPWIDCWKKGEQRVLREIPELEKQGFKCIPIGRVIPDIIALKDGKIYAIEVEYGKPNYTKYDKIKNYSGFSDVIWILRKR